MADKIKKVRSRYEDDERYDNEEEEYDEDEFEGGGRNYNRGGSGGSKYEKLYGVIDALVDQIDMPRNRIRAIKYGIRALGELLSETENRGRRSGGQGGRQSAGNNSAGSHSGNGRTPSKG